MHVLDVVVRCQYSLCEMGKTTGVIDTNLGIARLPMWCSVGWCGLSSRSGYCGGGRRAYGFATGSENFGRGTDPGTRVEGVACKNNTGHSRYLYLRLYEQSNPTYGFQTQICFTHLKVKS